MAIKHVALPIALVYKSKKLIAPGVYAFTFTSETPIAWKAGQHGLFEIPLLNGKTGRKPFSISSAPGEGGHVTITTRYNPTYAGSFKKSLYKMKRGTKAKLRGPVGRLYIKHPAKKYALLATGIGITPFRSILSQLSIDGHDTKVTLFYVGNKDNHFYREDLSQINSKLSNVKLNYIYKPERITGHIIEEGLGADLHDTIFLLSGSAQVVKAYRRTLQGLGVPRKHIKSDTFFGLKSAPQLAAIED